jgi:hypothetical protein
VNNPI